MALEDRCSPQSATSPTHRMPHSPHHHHSNHHSSPTSSPSSSTHTTTPNGTTSDTEMAHIVSSPHHSPEKMNETCTDMIIDVESVNIKTEQEDYDQDGRESITSPESPPVRFSITNILSDRFGKASPAGTQHRKGHLFRPYDIKEHVMHKMTGYPTMTHPYPSMALDHPAFTMQNLRLAEIYNDYSRKISNLSFETQMGQHPSPMTQQTLLNNFSSYPRIHEEILNSHKKFTQKLLQQHNNQDRHQTIKPPQITPPLGNLCKTVSQIGRPSPTTPCNASISPKSDRSSLISPPISSAQSQRSAQDAVDSSDDTKSETSSTTKGDGENGTSMWPAWVSHVPFMLSIKCSPFIVTLIVTKNLS